VERAATRRSAPVSREAAVLFTICFLDMLSSAVLFHQGLAVEANPLLRPYADAGVLPFMIVKTLTFAPTVLFIDAYGRIRPHFVRPLMRWASVIYLLIYASQVFIQWFG
jgi:hypothetical protein